MWDLPLKNAMRERERERERVFLPNMVTNSLSSPAQGWRVWEPQHIRVSEWAPVTGVVRQWYCDARLPLHNSYTRQESVEESTEWLLYTFISLQVVNSDVKKWSTSGRHRWRKGTHIFAGVLLEEQKIVDECVDIERVFVPHLDLRHHHWRGTPLFNKSTAYPRGPGVSSGVWWANVADQSLIFFVG